MNICLVADQLPGFHERWSGAELICWRLAEMLKQDGHSISFLTRQIDREGVPEEICQVATPLEQSGALGHIFPFDILCMIHCITHLRRLKPDVVHFYAAKLFLPALAAALLLRIPALFTVVDHFIFCPTLSLRKPDGRICTDYHGSRCAECSSQPVSWFKRLGQKFIYARRRILYDYFSRKLAGWVVLSKTSKARLERHGIPGHRIRVAYPFQPIFDGSSLQEAVDERRPTVLFVGWLNELRGLHVAVEAMAELVKEVPDARLMAVGSEEDTRYVARIKDMIKAFQLESNIQLLGKQKNEAVMQLIAESSAVVVPLQWPNEFGPVILVEAMALAKPIVASRVGAIPEFVEDGVNAFLVAPDQPKQFADKLRLLLTNKELAQAMGKKAQSSARLLCEEPTAKMVELYRSVAAHKKGITKVASVL